MAHRSQGEGAHLSVTVIRTVERWYVQHGDEAMAVDAEFTAERDPIGSQPTKA